MLGLVTRRHRTQLKRWMTWKWKVDFVDVWAMGMKEKEREGERERERASELNKPCTASSYFMQLAQFDNKTRARGGKE